MRLQDIDVTGFETLLLDRDGVLTDFVQMTM